MTNDEIVYNKLSDTGIPVARMFWGPYPPKFPRATYLSKPTYTYADNMNAADMPHYMASLFMKMWDSDLVDRFDQAVKSLGTCSMEESYDQASECYVAQWSFFLGNREVA